MDNQKNIKILKGAVNVISSDFKAFQSNFLHEKLLTEKTHPNQKPKTNSNTTTPPQQQNPPTHPNKQPQTNNRNEKQ